MQTGTVPTSVVVATTLTVLIGMGLPLLGVSLIRVGIDNEVPFVPEFGLVVILVGVANIVAAAGLVFSKSWAWTLRLSASVLTATVWMINLHVDFSPSGRVWIIGSALDPAEIGLVFPAVVIYFLVRPTVRHYLRTNW